MSIFLHALFSSRAGSLHETAGRTTDMRTDGQDA